MNRTTTGGFKLAEQWHSRGYLPHFDGELSPQFVTYRLAGTLPTKVLDSYKRKLDQGAISEIEYHDLIDAYLDDGTHETFLRLAEIAGLIEENLLRFDDMKYKLHAWVVMPNHVHVLFTPINGHKLSSIMHSIKSYTANRANQLLQRSDVFWATEYFDRYIRDGKHFSNTVAYIHNNPVKARLCRTAADWPFSSARFFAE
jgi:REP element-mobilizing transposase RayT